MPPEWLDDLVTRYRGRGLILDASPLLLLLVGRYDSRLLKADKRTAPCTVDHFEILEQVQIRLGSMQTTPAAATEALHYAEEFGQGLMGELQSTLSSLVEVYQPTKYLSERQEFPYLGLADTSILQLAIDTRSLVATIDHRTLGPALWSLGIDSIDPREFFRD